MLKKVSACIMCKGNCWGCLYAEECGNWNDTDPSDIPQVTVEVSEASMSLCEGRHPIPQAKDGSIFGNNVDPLDTEGLETVAEGKLSDLHIRKLNLYVTGLTVALVAVLNVCRGTKH